jgi:hypothetical protein
MIFMICALLLHEFLQIIFDACPFFLGRLNWQNHVKQLLKRVFFILGESLCNLQWLLSPSLMITSKAAAEIMEGVMFMLS